MAELRVDDSGAVVRLRLEGDVDVYVARALRDSLAAVAGGDAELSLELVTRLDTAGVQLVEWFVRAEGRRCVVRHGHASKAATAALGVTWPEGS